LSVDLGGIELSTVANFGEIVELDWSAAACRSSSVFGRENWGGLGIV
jgi:hypothetical protein